ncbi:cAMP-binding domain of CRP or a regulatory subunit of cAMP-dependent protein kinases [Clostridium collagenovorans DSM 3089]|uniref:cAMP-binding domain of CRP or a regulatory subunit of cAMP-dependent protein kinases n=1 Tax=Clostridium collagenovorans DSM 3089 TaxID=1121306 RepID=A0A1M5YFF3_9CLOT|nr:Crp/Fnr family transcriptional regulator [Clostridium collagenovorans]SHI10775.1 cAMP-binding domain of CRP or a regulatory subunit of cAMP-dependent protein kinases [Clostridium collagenovorans DSM 3089]
MRIYEGLKETKVFSDFSLQEIENILRDIDIKQCEYSKDEIIAFEGEDINRVGIVLEGTINVQKHYISGKILNINHLKKGDLFGEVIIFSSMDKYPSTIVCDKRCKVAFIYKEDIVKLCKNDTKFLTKFMGILSNKILMLNNRVRVLSYSTIREKIADYLLNQYKIQGTMVLKIKDNREKLAENFGVARPSISRELINMKKEDLIDYNKSTITIKDLDALEDIFM